MVPFDIAEKEFLSYLEDQFFDTDKEDWSEDVTDSYNNVIKEITKGRCSIEDGKLKFQTPDEDKPFTLVPITAGDLADMSLSGSGNMKDTMAMVSKFTKDEDGRNIPVSVIRNWKPSKINRLAVFVNFLM